MRLFSSIKRMMIALTAVIFDSVVDINMAKASEGSQDTSGTSSVVLPSSNSVFARLCHECHEPVHHPVLKLRSGYTLDPTSNGPIPVKDTA